MSWLALLLVGIGITDLVHSARHVPVLPECVGGGSVVLAGLVAGLTDLRDVLALAVIVAAVVAWGQSVSRGFGRGRPSVPLAVLSGAVLLAILASPAAGTAGGPLRDWLEHTSFPLLAHLSADRALLLLGAVLVQLSTGNVVVRLVLAATDTVSPIGQDDPSAPEVELKGGRLLGPMERLVIFGLGLAGQLTAASIVIAAKGLLRFPELQSRREQFKVHRLTEYFLVGSFVSWSIALASLLLAAR